MEMVKKSLNDRCDSFFKQFNDINDAVSTLYLGMDMYGIVDAVASKLLRLASCPSSTEGEKENAARAAFKRIAQV